MQQTKSQVAKLLVVGDAATGKTSVIRRYVYKTFEPDHQTTIGVDFSLKKLKIDGEILNVQLWDIAGQDRFASLARIYYKDAVAAIVVFNVTDRESFKSAANWKQDIDEKYDLIKQKEEEDENEEAETADGILYCDQFLEKPITDAEIDAFVEEHGFCGWFYTSAKTGDNIKAGLHYLIAQVVENSRKLRSENKQMPEPKDEGLKLEKDGDSEAGGCC